MDTSSREGSVEIIESNESRSASEEKEIDVILKEKLETFSHEGKKNKEERIKKKDDKSVEQVLKALSNLTTNEEKLAAVCKKYTDVVEENKKLQLLIKQNEKKVLVLEREKEQLQTKQGKTVLTRSRLESLCRELQKQNKQIKEESLQRIKEEEEKRNAVSRKFQSTLSEITYLMQMNNDSNSVLRTENVDMHNKVKTLIEQLDLKDKQMDKMGEQLKLESQLAEAKLAKIKIEIAAEKEILENEKKQLMMELVGCQNKCKQLEEIESNFKKQLNFYSEKFLDFQSALSKSNEVYTLHKNKMCKMSEKIKKLEEETLVWKKRWENNHKTLIQVAAEKQQKTSELALAGRQLAQLQKLCRTLQEDRTALLNQLKSEGITPKLKGDCNSHAENNSKTKNEINSESSVAIESNSEKNGEANDCNAVNNEIVGVDDNKLKEDVLDNNVELEESVFENTEEPSELVLNESKETSPQIEDIGDGDNKDIDIRKTESNIKKKKGKEGSKKKNK